MKDLKELDHHSWQTMFGQVCHPDLMTSFFPPLLLDIQHDLSAKPCFLRQSDLIVYIVSWTPPHRSVLCLKIGYPCFLSALAASEVRGEVNGQHKHVLQTYSYRRHCKGFVSSGTWLCTHVDMMEKRSAGSNGRPLGFLGVYPSHVCLFAQV